MGGREAFAQLVIPGSYVWVVGPTMDLAEKEFRKVWDLTVDKGFIPVVRKSERELYLKFANGSFLECRSEENPDQLIGEGLDGVVLAEAARLKHRTWDQYIRPALADRRGWAFFSSTPRGFNWFEEFYRRGADGAHPTWESWQIPSAANPILDAEEIEEARRTSTKEAFKQEWLAQFIAYGGLVFPEFSEQIHVNSNVEFVRDRRTALWIDPGTTAPYAVLLVQITPDERVFVIDEIYRTGETTPQIIAEAQEKWGEYILTSGGNPDPELDVIIDKAAAEAAATWRLNGYPAHGDKPKIKKGIEVHHMFLADPYSSTEEIIVPRIQFSPRCYNTIREHGNYHYPDNARKRVEVNPSDTPVDVDNHSIDALRYGYFNTWPELFNIGEEKEEIEQHSLDEFDPDLAASTQLGDY